MMVMGQHIGGKWPRLKRPVGRKDVEQAAEIEGLQFFSAD